MANNRLDVAFFVMGGKKDGETWEAPDRRHGRRAQLSIDASLVAIVVNQINVRRGVDRFSSSWNHSQLN